MKGIKSDNIFAFHMLYEKYSRKVFRFVYSMLKSVEDSENIVQDVFMNIWINRHRVDKDSSVKSYLFTITYNASVSVIRKKVKETEFLEYLSALPLQEFDPVNNEVEYNDLLVRIDTIVNELPARQKEIFRLHKFEGLKYHEISDRLNISVNTIENHMSCALKTIRKRLGAAG